MKNNRKVCLYDLEQLALIIKTKSGVTYFNQAGGDACMQPSVEGIFTFIEDDTKDALNFLMKYTLNKTNLTNEDADYIDVYFQGNRNTNFLSIDRHRLSESMEAWINVNICYQENSRTSFEGFIENEGVLTWSNSD